jgi:hypothetical protein
VRPREADRRGDRLSGRARLPAGRLITLLGRLRSLVGEFRREAVSFRAISRSGVADGLRSPRPADR